MKGNIFHRFAARSLGANVTRTVVTVVGIILSMALFTAVIEGAYSGIMYLQRAEIDVEGCWEGAYPEITAEQYEELMADDQIKDTQCLRAVGWAETGSENEYMPYLFIESASEGLEDYFKIHIESGRMPENENEILISEHAASAGDVKYNIGDTLSLDVGTRTYDGEIISDAAPYTDDGKEKIVDTVHRDYKITGIYSGMPAVLGNFYYPGYMAVTKGEAEGAVTAFFRVKNIRDFWQYADDQDKELQDKLMPHTDLLYYNGVSGNEGIMTMMVNLVIILVVLIMFGSITLIYNSFSISVSERTRQFGILRSVGATKKQIRSAVMYEALILSAVGIIGGAVLGCLGIGLTLLCLSNSFSSLVVWDTTVKLQLVISPIMLLIAAAICFITVIVSAWIPAGRAVRTAPVEAIRQTRDVVIKGKAVKTRRITQKLFGIEGVLASKNFKRNRKGGRSVILSMALSMILFISASSFCAYLTDSIDTYSSSDNGRDIAVSFFSEDVMSGADADRITNEIRALSDVDQAAFTVSVPGNFFAESGDLTENSRDAAFIIDDSKDTIKFDSEVVFLDDMSFDILCSESGYDKADFYDRSAPLALVNNHVEYSMYSDDDGYVRYYSMDVFIPDGQLPEITMIRSKSIPDYDFNRVDMDEDGNFHVYYCPMERVKDGNNLSHYYSGEPEEMPVDEVCRVSRLKTGGVIKCGEYFLRGGKPVFVYPLSMADAVIEGYAEDDMQSVLRSLSVKAERHAEAAERITEILDQKQIQANVYDQAESYESVRMLVTIINVFALGFIIIISLIAAANVFNTISTNIELRRRELAMLRSIGMSDKGFYRMMNYECMIYGMKGLIWGLPISAGVTYLIYLSVGVSRDVSFYIPWYSLVIAIGSIFLIVFAAMWYAAGKIRKQNTVETLRNENV